MDIQETRVMIRLVYVLIIYYVPIAKFSSNDNNFEDENLRNIDTVKFYF